MKSTVYLLGLYHRCCAVTDFLFMMLSLLMFILLLCSGINIVIHIMVKFVTKQISRLVMCQIMNVLCLQ
jgi:hypothetical protein